MKITLTASNVSLISIKVYSLLDTDEAIFNGPRTTPSLFPKNEDVEIFTNVDNSYYKSPCIKQNPFCLILQSRLRRKNLPLLARRFLLIFGQPGFFPGHPDLLIS